MGTITSSVGLISGINTGAIVTALIQADSGPVSLLQTRINSDQTLNTAYQSIASQLGTLQTTAQSLEQSTTFQAADATSSDPNVVTATAANGAATGSYNLQVAQLVSTQQLISTGFSDTTSATVGAGTITIDAGASNLATQTTLADLNGGAGVSGGEFRITDRSGASAVINTSSAVTLDDVVNDINNSTDISVRASIENNHLVLTDTSGKTTGNLIVQDLGTGSTAEDLGIAQNVASSTITGTDINYLSSDTSLAQINDGRGLTLGSGNGDLRITAANGSSFTVNLATAKTVGDVITDINNASGGKVTASIPTGSAGISLTDNTTGAGLLSVTDINGSKAAEGLGLTVTSSGGTLTGKDLIAGIDTTLISSLNGGSGLSLGSVNFTDRAGQSETINFSNANNVQDIINDINNATGVHLSASLNSAGNGIQITDTSGGTGNLTISDANGGTTASQLGIAGTFSDSQTTVDGANLHKQWVTNNTLLSTLNGGKGIDPSSFTITNSAGATTTVSLAGTNVTTVGDLLYQINSKDLAGVTASINSNGNGIEITDTSGGSGKLTIADTDGTAASDLNIAGTATGNTINGAYEKTLTVTANDTLTTLAQKINALDFGVNATIINDGSGTSPYRLSLTANNSGTAGGVVFDAGTTNLDTQTLVAAQDAAVFVGNSNTSQPLLITSSSNQISDVIQGVTLNLTGVSTDGPVQINVSQNTSGIAQSLSTFVSTFNTLVSSINSQSTYNSSSNSAGLLLGDPVAQQVESTIYNVLNTVVPTAGQYKVLSSLGITVGSNGQLSFDQDTFNQAIADDPQAVEQLFNASSTTTDPTTGKQTTTNSGVAYAIDNALSQLVAPISGVVTSAETELTTESQGFQDQITQLNTLLAQKKAQLEAQFANMESVLAGLQTQQQSLSSISSISSSSGSSSSSSSSSASSSSSG
jgi:flagellar hook-associated protein 2